MVALQTDSIAKDPKVDKYTVIDRVKLLAASLGKILMIGLMTSDYCIIFNVPLILLLNCPSLKLAVFDSFSDTLRTINMQC